MTQELLLILILFIVPVLLLYYKIIPFKFKVHTLGMITGLLLIIIFYRRWSLKKIGIRFDNIDETLVPYILFTFGMSLAIVIIAKILKRKNIKHWWKDNHFLYGFILVSFLQELIFRGFLMPELGLIFSSIFIIVLVNAILYTFIHIIYADDLYVLIMVFVGGVGFACIYFYFPNLLLISISHSILNFIIVYYGFFTHEKVLIENRFN